MDFLPHKQREEFTALNSEFEKTSMILSSFYDSLNQGEIIAKSKNGEAILNSLLKNLRNHVLYAKVKLLPYNELIDEYYQERDRICREFNDDFMIKEETVHAINELTEKYRKKAESIDQKQSSRLKQI